MRLFGDYDGSLHEVFDLVIFRMQVSIYFPELAVVLLGLGGSARVQVVVGNYFVELCVLLFGKIGDGLLHLNYNRTNSIHQPYMILLAF